MKMLTKEELSKEIIDAMKAKDAVRKETLQGLKAAIQNDEIKHQRELTDVELVAVAKREAKQFKDAIDGAKKADRPDLIDRYTNQFSVVAEFLPETLSQEKILEILTEKGAKKGMKMGQLMGMIMKDHKSEVDGADVKVVIEKHFVD